MASSISADSTFLRVVIRKDFLKVIQDYRFKHRNNTTSDAVRALIGYGLLAQGFVKAAKGVTLEPPFSGAVPEIRNGVLTGWSADL